MSDNCRKLATAYLGLFFSHLAKLNFCITLKIVDTHFGGGVLLLYAVSTFCDCFEGGKYSFLRLVAKNICLVFLNAE